MSDFLDLEDLAERAESTYRKRFASTPKWIVAAPGRVNLIGEHTDYNDGLVLPMAIDRYTVVAAGAAEETDDAAHVYGATVGDQQSIPLDNSEDTLPVWAKYVQGVMRVLQSESLRVAPFQAVIDSTVPLGGGLSSSAALEVAVATLVEEMNGVRLNPVRKALLCQRAEHEGVGMPCGIMDQFSSVLCQAHHLMLLDCRSQQFEMVPLADSQVAILIINSNVKHELAGGEYAKRRSQCEAAAQKLGVCSLRDVSSAMLAEKAGTLEPILLQRARHVVSEIERTARAAEAMRSGDWDLVGQLMYASHDSLRDDYEVSCPELDTLVVAALELGADGGVIGSRMTGGGFGGCTVSLVQSSAASDIQQAVCGRYRAETRIEASAFSTVPAQGAHVVRG